MTNSNTTRIQSGHRVAALAVAFAFSLPPTAHAQEVRPPAVPSTIQVPPGHRAFLEGHGIGTQNYICLPTATGFAFALFTPEATLFDDGGRQVTTHFFGPNPFEKNTIRAAWQHSKDTSTVWGKVNAASFDPDFVTPGAIPWLLVQAVGTQNGPTIGDQRFHPGVLTVTTFIQRVNTSGGAAPATGCSVSTDVGNKEFVPYTADYIFYSADSN